MTYRVARPDMVIVAANPKKLLSCELPADHHNMVLGCI